MAAAFARRAVSERGLEDRVAVASGGTRPADAVHDVVVRVMAEVGLDVADERPRAMPETELATCDHVATMGCSTLSLPESVTTHDWALDDPGEADTETARRIRDEVAARVEALFDDLQRESATTSEVSTDE
jgi:protein-tyrosine-phosphatase